MTTDATLPPDFGEVVDATLAWPSRAKLALAQSLLQAINGDLPPVTDESAQLPLAERIRKARGAFRDVLPAVDDYIAEKRLEPF